MLPSCAADGNDSLRFSLVFILRNDKTEQIEQFFVEFLRVRPTEYVIGHFFIQAGHGTHFFNIIRIWQKTDIKNQIRIQRNAMLESERHKVDAEHGSFV